MDLILGVIRYFPSLEPQRRETTVLLSDPFYTTQFSCKVTYLFYKTKRKDKASLSHESNAPRIWTIYYSSDDVIRTNSPDLSDRLHQHFRSSPYILDPSVTKRQQMAYKRISRDAICPSTSNVIVKH